MQQNLVMEEKLGSIFGVLNIFSNSTSSGRRHTVCTDTNTDAAPLTEIFSDVVGQAVNNVVNAVSGMMSSVSEKLSDTSSGIFRLQNAQCSTENRRARMRELYCHPNNTAISQENAEIMGQDVFSSQACIDRRRERRKRFYSADCSKTYERTKSTTDSSGNTSPRTAWHLRQRNRCKDWVTSLPDKQFQRPMLKSNSVSINLTNHHMNLVRRKERHLSKAHSDVGRSLPQDRMKSFRSQGGYDEVSLLGSFPSIDVDDSDSYIEMKTMCKQDSPKLLIKTKTQEYARFTSSNLSSYSQAEQDVKSVHNVNVSRNEKSVDNISATSKSTVFVHSESGWRMEGDGTVNIIPENEQIFPRTPHTKRKNTTSVSTISKTEMGYIFNKVYENAQGRKSVSDNSVDQILASKGKLDFSIQFLFMSRRLKVSVNSLDFSSEEIELDNRSNRKSASGGRNSDVINGNAAYVNEPVKSEKRAYFVKVCTVPKRSKQKRTNTKSGVDKVSFDEDIYMKNVTFENVHLLTLRFQVFQRKSMFSLKRNKFIGETTVTLDNLDVVGRVNLCQALTSFQS